LSVTATVTDFDGAVLRVDYFANGVPIGTTETSPHVLVWQPAEPGVYDLTARAHDDQESSSLFESVRIEVLRPFDFWSQQYFTAPQLQDPLVGGNQGDPDYDNIGNLLEYAFGFSPWESNSAPTEASPHETRRGRDHPGVGQDPAGTMADRPRTHDCRTAHGRRWLRRDACTGQGTAFHAQRFGILPASRLLAARTLITPSRLDRCKEFPG
jgi:hypothetical protein